MLTLVDPRASLFDTVEERLWSADDLAGETAGRAAQLATLGVEPGARVAILQDNSPGFFLDLLATWSLGGVAACIDPSSPEAELETTLAFLRPTVVAGERGHRKPHGSLSRPARHKGGAIDDPALILLTSGTTAGPKAVVLSYRALLARLSLNRREIGDAALRRTLVTLPVHFGHGLIGNALTPLAAGGMIVLAGRGLALASNLGALIDRHSISFLTSVPAFWRLALKTSKRPVGSCLERVHVGSAPLSGALWEKIVAWAGCEVFNCYGMTETGNWFSGASSAGGCVDNLVGAPWGGRAGVLGSDGAVRSAGEGEIVVLTPSVMSGYLDRVDLTRAAFIQGWYRTGDAGRIDASGSIVLTGRLKDEINRGGFKVQPAQVERVIEAHPDVAEACAFGIPDAVSGEVVAIAVKPARSTLDVGRLRHWCAGRLRREAIPERWYVVADIPRTPRGKLSREHIRQTLAGSG